MNNLMVVMDRTTSMKHTFHPFADFMVKYAMRKALEDDPLETVGLVLFDDHAPPGGRGRETELPILELHSPTDNLEEFASWLYTAEIGNGNDIAEAISCAYKKAVEIAVPNSSIWIVTDSIPHGMRFPSRGEYEGYDDYRRGCPCGCPLPPTNSKILFIGSSTWSILRYVWEANDYKNIVELGDFMEETERIIYA